MSIDEAIERYKCFAYDKSIICSECEEDFKQLAEWLEELKELREYKCKYFNLEHKECSISNNTYEDGYNKVINDFADGLCCQACFTNSQKDAIRNFIEQLKGENNE